MRLDFLKILGKVVGQIKEVIIITAYVWAWSLYNAKKNSDDKNKILKCDAIPENAFSDNYVSKFSQGWNKWNDLELDNQIINGVESLMQNCYLNETISSEKREKLRQKYCEFTKNHNVLKNRDMYQSHCIQ